MMQLQSRYLVNAPHALLPGGVPLSRTGYFSTKARLPPSSVVVSFTLTSDSLSEAHVSLPCQDNSGSSSVLVLPLLQSLREQHQWLQSSWF